MTKSHMEVDADVDVQSLLFLLRLTSSRSCQVLWVGHYGDSPCSGRNTDHALERTYTYSPTPQQETAAPAIEDAQVLPIQFHFHRYLMTH